VSFLTSLLTSIVTSSLTSILYSDFLKKDTGLETVSTHGGQGFPLARNEAIRGPGGLAEAMNVNAIYCQTPPPDGTPSERGTRKPF